MPIGRWEGNPHGIPEFEPHESFSDDSQELNNSNEESAVRVFSSEKVASRRVEKNPHGIPEFETEVRRPIKFTRTELIRNLNSMAGQLSYVHLDVSEKRRFETISRPMPQIASSKDALFFTLESIDQRMLSLLHPLCERTQEQPEAVLEEMFPYYVQLSKHAKMKPYIDDGKDRELRHQLLPEDVRWPVEDIEKKLDQCEFQHFGRYRLAFSQIFPIYDETFGSLPFTSECLRPWRNEEVMNSLVQSLSAEAESDITPIPEINENDELA